MMVLPHTSQFSIKIHSMADIVTKIKNKIFLSLWIVTGGTLTLIYLDYITLKNAGNYIFSLFCTIWPNRVTYN